MFNGFLRPWGLGLSRAFSLLLVLPIVLSGCGGLAPKTTTVNYYPTCYAPIAKLREEEKKFATNVAAGVIIGTVIGAALGAAVGGARGAIIGAGLGAGTGGLLGYAKAKQDKIKNDRERRASISKDIDGDISSMDSIALAAAASRQCYSDQFDIELSKFKQGQMSKEEFKQRAGEIIGGLNEVASLVKSSYSGADQKLSQYKNAMDAEYKKDGQTPPQLTAEKRVKPAPVAVSEPAPVPDKKSKSAKKSASKKPVEQTVEPAPQPQAPALPDGQALDGGAKRCNIMAGIRDELKTESDVTTAKASDCLRITQEVTTQMKSDLPLSGSTLTLFVPHQTGQFEARPQG